MIRLPLYHYTNRGIEVDVVDGNVSLDVELETCETTSRGWSTLRTKLADVGPLLDRYRGGDATVPPVFEHARTFVALIDALAEELDTASNHPRIDRTMNPDEARALAAMLTHYAAEV